MGGKEVNSVEAIWAAIHHYESEVKNNKTYAKPILDGLKLALKQVEKYEQILSYVEVKK